MTTKAGETIRGDHFKVKQSDIDKARQTAKPNASLLERTREIVANLPMHIDTGQGVDLRYDPGRRQEILDGWWDTAPPMLAALAALASSEAGEKAVRIAIARCIEVVREVHDGFLSEEYAVDQPMASFNERIACNQCAAAIENEFAMGTMEQCELLGKPTPFEVFRAQQEKDQ